MPEVYFRVRWPDGTTESCYSPSTVIREFFVTGESYTVADFLARSTAGLNRASERVAAKYGMPCSRARAQLDRIEAACRRFDALTGATVTLDSFNE